MQLYNGPISKDNNMGFVRYALALAVMVAHFNYCFGTDYRFPLTSAQAVGGFFALSGFLILGSFQRSPGVRKFIVKRARKILPPYVLIVVACAFLFYFAVSPGQRQDYFSFGWLKYLAANLSFMNFLAPGMPSVYGGEALNGSLWTVKVEWMLYLSVPLFVWCSARWVRLGKVRLILILYAMSVAYKVAFFYMFDITGSEIYRIMARQVFGQIAYFYTGGLVYLLYDRFKARIFRIGIIVFAALAAGYCLAAAVDAFGEEASAAAAILSTVHRAYSYIFEPGLVATAVIVLSVCGRSLRIFNANNFSYEIYLFHMPVFVALSHSSLPQIIGVGATFWLSFSLIFIFSFLAWFFIDKPLLHPRRNRVQGGKIREIKNNAQS